MEVHSIGKEKGPLVALVLALIVLGLGSLYLTWRSIAHQREIVEGHIVMTGGSILRGVDNNLSRIARSMRVNPLISPIFPSMAEDLFQELSKSDDIVFISLCDAEGKPLASSDKEAGFPVVALPDMVTRDLEPGRAFHAMAEVDKKAVLISGLRVRATTALLARGEPIPSRRQGRGAGSGAGSGAGPGMGHGMMEPGMPPDPALDLPPGFEVPPVYLLVGLNAEKHLAQFRQYRRAATYQTGYVFLAAVVLWSLAFAYLRRKGEGRKLVRLERFQSKLLDNMPDGLVTLSESGEIMAANHSAKKLLAPKGAQGAPEIIGVNWGDYPFARRAGETASTASYNWEQFDYQGRQLEILSLSFQGLDEDAAPELGQRLMLIRDRTQIRSLEEDLNEAKRLAAIGSLAAGVAHEVRNPLSSLRGFAQLFASKLKDQPPLDQYAATMVQEADRLNRVVTDLLYLAKPRRLDPVETDLAEVGESLRQLMRFDFKNKQIEPVFDFAQPTVYADQDALRQVLLNLISNSLDAIVACEECHKPGHVCLTSERVEGGVCIVVADDGPGMDPDMSDDVFKPFVTGKKTGTGLGLAIVQNIMRAHRGKAVLDSRPDEGVRVRLFFPDGPDGSRDGSTNGSTNGSGTGTGNGPEPADDPAREA
ncbi:MAG: ATPase [Pseudodesulfovibrio sp.]|uniref:histidine kinase n=1 Tax=Pseudodesulfovibrio aespoeensis (strain ATCC 700646 / DSM 10631 / Aspo-2) TaxID=643562 RepID=E6VXJ0_PSEA9|nr:MULTISPECIES: ATP-binding protein [Pseudodesulfovibrio]MBU4193043.1 ATPase [Pseudomonadota bacterium]ADU63806.1 ATP-binding region ATPase domain protein [Pseudodesulfovibrio aespoeensis Aspo-2]MBU4242936.1 ATPase [Pseudomonadota bacterium]MBU4379210.1 ATPase [Pseudomonadota bacterium]MBU4475608.1 ATPase [Pseudomonadota bacterium]